MTDSRTALLQGAAELGLSLAQEQTERLLAYGALILKWNKVYNLTALRDADAVMTHHLLDCLSIIPPLYRKWPGSASLLDVGSGAGLPGVVIAVMRPDIEVTCLDAVAKKVAFVKQVSAELRLSNLHALHARVETLETQYQLISSRAFSSLDDFVAGSFDSLAPGGLWLAMKGKDPSAEVAELPSNIDVFHVEQLTVPGLNADRCIVWLRKSGD